MTPPPTTPALWRTFQWAAFLACSWTWCIGMFLPVLLLRDFGILGYAAFFVPNIIGAAAMGWVLRSGDASRRLVGEHLTACRAFSMVTASFQLFFGAWLLTSIAGAWLPMTAVATITLALLIASRSSLRTAVSLWLLSAAALVTLLFTGDACPPASLRAGELPLLDVLYLAPACVFGFMLCPYLDMTFHSAAQGAGDRRRAAFTLGFGALFAAMILFTLLYARFLQTRPTLAAAGPPWVLGIIVAHIAAQLVYTFALHHTYLRESAPAARNRPAALYPALLIISGAAGALAPRLPAAWGLSFGELIYRTFMATYGLLFPAYVWICMIPRHGNSGLTREKLRVWALAVGIALPMFAAGFLMRHTFWLAPGLTVVLLARLLVRPAMAAAGPSTA
jgi:hypothetical protein